MKKFKDKIVTKTISKIKNKIFVCIVVVFCLSFQIINTYTEAVQTVDANQATGKLYTLWVEFAKYYEKHGQIPEVKTNKQTDKQNDSLLTQNF